jgi:hypothetical protein
MNDKDALFGPLLVVSTSLNLALGITFITSDFVKTAFPKATATFTRDLLSTGPSSRKLETVRELKRGFAKNIFPRKTAVVPAKVENKCEIVPDDACEFGGNQEGAHGYITQERSAVPVPLAVEENALVERIYGSSKVRKMTSILH